MIKKVIKKIYKIFFKETPTEKFNREEQESYQEWIKNNEPDTDELEKQRNTKFMKAPKISIIIPLFKTPKKYFEELVDSINGQTYQNWELCLADGSDEESTYIKNIVEMYGDKIKYKFIGGNKGISGNSNEALKLATGEYIALLDHDDLIPKFALFEVVKAINENPEVDFIYSDEDKILDICGKNVRISPHFKQDYALDTLRSYNYICHFSVLSKELLAKIGFFNSQFDGSQDYDLILRATENAKKIVHIPKILYNWRISQQSVASGATAKPYAYEAAKRAILASLERSNIYNAKVRDSKIIGLYDITYPIIENAKISIIIPNQNNKKMLKKCINSIMKSTYKNFEVIIIENNSTEKSILKYYKKINKNDKIRIESVDDKNLNYSKLYNFGASKSSGEYLVFVNNTIKIISKNWLESILSNCQRNEVGCIGAKILSKNNKIQHAGMALNLMGVVGNINNNEKNNNPGYFGRIMIQQNVTAVSGALLGISKKVFNEINGFDDSFSDIYNDVDLCLKINEIGKLVIYNPHIVAYNYKLIQPNNRNGVASEKDKEDIKIKEKWKKYFERGDKYFSPNFCKDVPNMRISPKKIK